MIDVFVYFLTLIVGVFRITDDNYSNGDLDTQQISVNYEGCWNTVSSIFLLYTHSYDVIDIFFLSQINNRVRLF